MKSQPVAIATKIKRGLLRPTYQAPRQTGRTEGKKDVRRIVAAEARQLSCCGTGWRAFRLALFAVVTLLQSVWIGASEPPKNLFANPSFELGQEGWRLEKAGKTECQFSVDDTDAADGRYSAKLQLSSVEDWGMQFGQSFPAGEKGKTFTFSAFARSAEEPVEVGLQIERSAQPWDRAGGGHFKLTKDWQELHLTFRVEKEFPQGWFAYLSCVQPKAQIRADMFRLYEGPYVPYKEVAQQELASMAVRVFDANTTSTVPLSGEALSRRAGWTEIAEDDLTHRFNGDAVFMNDRIGFVLRHGARGAEVYSLASEGSARRSVLAPVGGVEAATLSSLILVQNNPVAGAADVVFTAPGGQALKLRYELKAGEPILLTSAQDGVTSLCIEAPCRFAVMPDFFADDIVIDASELPVREAELPGDNLLLHLLPDGNAILMTVVKSSEEDVRVALSGQKEKRLIDSSQLRYGKDGKIWVAILARPAIWHMQEIAREQAGQIIRLPWKAPFPAQWRIDWRREKSLSDSWEMLIERPDGQFTKYGVFGAPDVIPADRKRWTTVLGEFNYPCWLDQDGQGCLQPLRHPALRFEGPAIIYPLNRAPATALDTFTVIDVMRNTLGVGPCEYVLDVEGQKSQYKGRATCSVRDTLNPIYSRHEQKQRRAEIERTLQDLMVFIRHIRGRIESYVAFGHETLGYLAQEKSAHPELANPLSQLETVARITDAKFAARKDAIKTPDDAAKMVEEFRKNVLDYDGDDALARCRRLTEGWVEIGGNQDELAGECRWAVKMLRQTAGLLMATDPRMAEIGKELRRRSQTVLRSPAIHEGARH